MLESYRHTQIDAGTHTDADTKHSNYLTCTDSFTFVFMDPVPNVLRQYVADFLQWCVDKCTSPTSLHTRFDPLTAIFSL